MQSLNTKQFDDFDPILEEQMLALKYAVDSSPVHTTTLRLNGLYDPINKKFLQQGFQNYAVSDSMTIDQLRQIWWQSNYKKLAKKELTADQYVLTYNLDFVLQPTQTIADVKKKLQKEMFDPSAVIWVYDDWDCPLEEDQNAAFSYESYEENNLTQIETTFKFRSTAPHNSCYFYVKTHLKTTIQQLKQSIIKHLSAPTQKSLIKSKKPLEKSSFRLLIKKDAINQDKLESILQKLKENHIYFDQKSNQLDFTNLEDSKIREICPPGDTIYIEFQDQSAIQVVKGLDKHKNKKIRIVCYQNVQKTTIGAPTEEQKIIEQKVIERLFSEIRNLKVHTLLHEERIQNPLTTSINCSQMTIKPEDMFQKFQNLIFASNEEVLNLYTFPQNFLYYKAIQDLESIKMSQIIEKLREKALLEQKGRSQCQKKRQCHRNSAIDPIFRTQDFLDPIVFYTSPYIYPTFNKHLRANSISLVQKQTILNSLENLWHYPFSEKLIKSLNKLPNFYGKVFRVSAKHNYNFSDDEVFEWNSFTSTTKDQKTAIKFLKGMLKKQDPTSISPNLTYFFEIQSYSGKDISTFSFYPSQKEVLLLPYTKFKILSQEKKTLQNEKIQVTYVRLVEIPIPKKIPGNIVVWIDANISQNSKAFNRIIENNGYTNCDLIQLVSNEHFELWLKQFKETLSLPGVNVQFISNMNRPPYFKQEGLKTLEIIRSFNKKAKVIFYIGNVVKTREILKGYWEEKKIQEDENIEVVQTLKMLNNVFQEIMANQQQNK